MTSHIHLIFRSIKGQKPELLIGDLKRFTSKSIVKAIQENPRESRKGFLLDFFKSEAKKSSNVTPLVHESFRVPSYKTPQLYSPVDVRILSGKCLVYC